MNLIPDRIPKGSYTGECQRTTCVQRPAYYWNPHTERFYCVHCARRINEALPAGLKRIESVPPPRAKGKE